jgi:hypothetical protein
MIRITRRASIALLALALAIAAATVWRFHRETPEGPSPTEVWAEDYDSFWLWAGVRPQPALAQARRIYLLEAEVRAGPPARLINQRAATPRIREAEVWMVIRVESLRWPPEIYGQVNAKIVEWRAAGNRLAGVQIDFDAGTYHLEGYAMFLARLRRVLPPEVKLGVTGLLDWSANADPTGLDALSGAVDEVVLQIYQGRDVIPGYRSWLRNVDRIKVPFRIGLIQGGEWQAPPGLEKHPHFQGYVVFLVNRSDNPVGRRLS